MWINCTYILCKQACKFQTTAFKSVRFSIFLQSTQRALHCIKYLRVKRGLKSVYSSIFWWLCAKVQSWLPPAVWTMSCNFSQNIFGAAGITILAKKNFEMNNGREDKWISKVNASSLLQPETCRNLFRSNCWLYFLSCDFFLLLSSLWSMRNCCWWCLQATIKLRK